MKILTKSLLATGAVAMFLIAGSPAALADPALVINRGTGLCGMPGADADGNIIFGGFGVAQTIVENDNIVIFTCKGSDLTNLSGRGQSFSGFGCGVVLPSGGVQGTNDTHATVAASGKGSMTCILLK